MKRIKYSEITPEKIYNNRRSFIKSIGFSASSIAITSLPFVNNALGKEQDQLTSFKDITTYNNYYEFGTSKGDPYKNSQNFKIKPWNISIEGEVEKPIKLSMEEISNSFTSEERIYRLRCVEGWSMVIPWMGFSLSKLLSKVNPTSKAKFVAFESVYDPEQMKGQRYPVLNWPYKEGLRIDEAMHPLTTVVTGLYNKELPNQNGAPLRIFIPWKYGFKSAKAIVKIKLVEKMPTSSWMWASPREYGFYSNVNPNVDHPRWSQATERIIGEGIWTPRVKTLMFNGYGDEVANLYTGMDLKNTFNEKVLQTINFFFSLIPFFLIIYKTIFNKLGPEPVKEITHLTGEWTLLFIIFTLSMSPLKKITKLNIWISFRRMLGLFLFFYATLHMLTYVVIDYRLNFESISKDILTKKFIFVGFAAWVLLLPLALTSSKKALIYLKDKWKKLHRLIYVIAILGVTHFIWLVKKDLTEPLIYAVIILILLLFRFKFKRI